MEHCENRQSIFEEGAREVEAGVLCFVVPQQWDWTEAAVEVHGLRVETLEVKMKSPPLPLALNRESRSIDWLPKLGRPC